VNARVSEWILNGTSAQLGYTVPFTTGAKHPVFLTNHLADIRQKTDLQLTTT